MFDQSGNQTPNGSQISNSSNHKKSFTKTEARSPSKNKKQTNLNFNLMLGLPLIIKEKGFLERKTTIQVFKRQKQQAPQNPLSHRIVRSKILNSGRIYINEFWSEKYQQQILKDSKISQQLESLKSLSRRNVNVIVGEMHTVVKQKVGGIQQIVVINIRENLQGYNKMIDQYRSVLNTQKNIQNIETLDHVAKQNFYEFKLTEEKLIKMYSGRRSIKKEDLYHNKTENSQSCYQGLVLAPLKTSRPIQLDFQELIEKCDYAQHPFRDMNQIREKPWRVNSLPLLQFLPPKKIR